MPRTRSSTSGTSSELPSDLHIFSPAVVIQALCSQYDANRCPAARDCAMLVLVVREAQVDAAAVDVEGGAEVLRGHRRALDVPAGAARAPRRRPRRGLRLGAFFQPFQSAKSRGSRLPRGSASSAGLHVVDLLAGQLAVRRPASARRSRRRRAVLGRVGVAARDQLPDQLEHLRHVPGRGRLVGRRQHVERVERLVELAASSGRRWSYQGRPCSAALARILSSMSVTLRMNVTS